MNVFQHRSANGGTTRRAVLRAGLATGVAACVALRHSGQGHAAEAPPPPRDDTVEKLHGVTVADPFRPLESADRADVQAWIEAHDARARAYLSTLATRDPVRKFFDAILDYPKTTVPSRFGTRYFAYFTDGLEDQRRCGVQDRLGGLRRTLIDPNKLSPDGTVSVSEIFPDRFGSKVAYLLSEAGSDRQTLRVRDVDSGRDLPDVLMWCKHTSVAWHPDGSSFFYSRYPGNHEPSDWDRRNQILCVHRVGEPQSVDRVIFRLPEWRDVYLRVETSFDARLLKIDSAIGTSEKAGYYIAPVDDPSRISELFPIDVAGFSPVANLDAVHYALTNLGAPKWRLVRIDPANPKPDRWQTVIPESDVALDSVAVFDRGLVARHTDNVNQRVTLYDLDGRMRLTVDLGGLEAVSFGRSYREDDHLLLEVDDYQRPSRIERLDLAGGKTALFRASAAKHDLSDAVVRQVFVTSRDGTRFPMTLIHRPGIALDRSNRTLLNAYGGFGSSIVPGYSEVIAAWVRLGGIYAIASIRGGGEYGQAWHDGGRLANKQNSFDDFNAAAEWLVDNNYTGPERLGINGASNGGLLVLACMLQRPELFGAVVAEVPVTDMIRYPKFTFGGDWIPEYGDPDKEADFRVLMAYSPLHNLRPGRRYPPLLVLTADNDDRVVPAHSYKFVAAMQTGSPDSETYLRVERRAGHGDGNALSKSLDGSGDLIAFLCDKLGGPLLALPKI